MNLKAIIKSWNPWHLRKRVNDLEKLIECKHEFVDSCHEFIVKQNLERGEEIVRLIKENQQLKYQRAANYTGLMTECEKLKEENERLTSERVQILSFFKMNAVVQRHNAQKMLETCEHYQNDKGNTHEK